MASMNRVFLAGNLTADPDLHQTGGGTAVAALRLAVSETYTNKDGQQVESTCFADIVAWGRQATACGEHLAKGSAILVEGRLETDSWETGQGEKRSRLRIRADRVQFLGRPRNGPDAPPAPAPAKTVSRGPAGR